MLSIKFWQFFALLSYAAIMGSSQLIMVNASKQIGALLADKGILFALVHSFWLYIAIAFYVIATGYWLYLLYRIDIRIAYPIASTSVIFAALFQSIQDGKILPPTYWVGLIIIILGIALINLGSHS